MSTTQARAHRAGRAGFVFAALTLAAGLTAGVGPAGASAETVVAITFDDGRASQMEALPYLAEHNMKATFYLNSGRIGRRNFVDAAQVAQMATAGHEIGSHTVDHTVVHTMTQAQAEAVICPDVAALRDLGHDTVSFAYPEGASSPESRAAVAACGLTNARGVGGIKSPHGCFSCPVAERIPPRNPFHLATPPSVKSTTTLAELQGYVTAAEQGGGGLVALVFHDVGTSGSLSVSKAVFDSFLDWLAPRAGRGTTVRTVGDTLATTTTPTTTTTTAPATTTTTTAPTTTTTTAPPTQSPPPAPNLVKNPSLEQRSGSAPTCFSRTGFGTSTFSWEGVADARTGAWAERLTISAISSGDRKLVPTMSAGCALEASAGTAYDMSVWYKSSATTFPVTYYLDSGGTWRYWATFAGQPASSTWTQARWRTAPLPTGATAMSLGLALTLTGTVTTDDYHAAAAP
jgi:peptidoglycan/xylan/chitin deacetylase (PgdA/CDA1 family)